MPVVARNSSNETVVFDTPCDVPDGWRALNHENSTLTTDGNGNTFEQYSDNDLGFHFAHRVDPAPTVIVPLPVGEETDVQVLESILMIDQGEYEALNNSTQPREAPPAISLRVYAGEAASLESWVETYPQQSLALLRTGDMERVTIGTVPALRYLADGLYQNDVVVLAHNGNTFVFVGSFDGIESVQRRDFLTLLDSLTFF